MSDVSLDSAGGVSGAGALIRQVREAQSVSIDALASIIKVPVAKLEALEAEDWSFLPDANLNRALAMTVCRALKVEAAPIMALMPAAVVKSLAAAKAPLNQPFRDFSHTGLTFESSSPLGIRVPKMSSAVVGPVVLLLLAAGVYFAPDQVDVEAWFPALLVSDAPQPAVPASGVALGLPVPMPVLEVASAVSPAAVSVVPAVASAASVVAASSAPASPAPVASVAQSVRTAPVAASAVVAQPSPASVVPSSASAPSGPLAKMTLSAKESAWIEVRDASGQKLFSRLLAGGERVELQGRPPLNVHAGNAPTVSIQFNGRPVDLVAVTRQNVARIELK
jgi:cytoskeleton protein RodZ